MNTTFHRILSPAFTFILVIAALGAAPTQAIGAVSAPSAGEPVYYVNGVAPPGGNGSSWATAFQGLQEAILAVQVTAVCQTNPCQIWVAQGAYSRAEGNNFHLNGGLEEIYGGFSGDETLLSQRNWRAHPTTLVGNHANVVYAYYFVGVLDGFTITGGETVATGPNSRGGGIYLECGAPGLFNLNIVGNSAGTYGGGLYAYNSGCSNPGYYPLLINVVFSGNSATSGGGIALLGSSPILINAVFSGNSAAQGDGIYDYNGSPTLTNVSMSGNGIYNDLQSSPTIQNSILWGLTNAITNAGSKVPSITYSLVEGCKPEGGWNSVCGTDGGHNLADVDPKFVLPGDMHLQETSPAIDQGNNAFIPGYVTPTDLDGNPRIVGAAVDLGAYEFQSANTPPVVTNFNKIGWKDQDITFSAADFISHFSDADGDSLSSIRITFLPSPGTLYLVGTPVTVSQEIPVGSLGDLYFTTASGWSGIVSFGWTASDGKVYSGNPATVTMTIYAVHAFIPTIKN